MDSFAVAREVDVAAQLARSSEEASDATCSTGPVPPTVFPRQTGPARRCARVSRPAWLARPASRA